MSQENIEVVREAVDSFNAFMRGELSAEAAMEILDPQIEVSWHEERSMPDLPQSLRGATELLGYAAERRAIDLILELGEFIEAPGDRVVTPLIQRFGGGEGIVPYESHLSYVWTIADRRVQTVEIYLRREEALAAARVAD